jgi:F-type H+-transporting ATPase subunit alpha
LDLILDEATQKQLARGERLVELLKQKQYSPMEVWDQTIAIYAATKGYFDTVPTEKVPEVEVGLLGTIKSKHSDIRDSIANEKQITAETESKLIEAIKSFISASGY